MKLIASDGGDEGEHNCVGFVEISDISEHRMILLKKIVQFDRV